MTTTPAATAEGAAEETETGGATEQMTAKIVETTAEMTGRMIAETTAVTTRLGGEAAGQGTDRRTSNGRQTMTAKAADASGTLGASSPGPAAATSARMTAGPRPTTGYPALLPSGSVSGSALPTAGILVREAEGGLRMGD